MTTAEPLEAIPTTLPPRRRVGRTVLLFAIVFFGGGLTGGGVATWYWQTYSRPSFGGFGFSSDRIINQMKTDLELNDGQVQQLKAVMQRHQKTLDVLRTEYHPKFKEVMDQRHQEFATVLTVEQRVRWEEKLSELRKSWAKRHEQRDVQRREGDRDKSRDGNRAAPMKPPEADPATESSAPIEKSES